MLRRPTRSTRTDTLFPYTTLFRSNDLQFILLSTASNREDGNLLPAPDSVTADPDRVKTAVTSLVRRKLAMKSNDHIVITDAGRAAIGADEAAAPEQADSATNITENNAEHLAEPAAPSAREGTKAENGRAHVRTPVTHAQLVCPL